MEGFHKFMIAKYVQFQGANIRKSALKQKGSHKEKKPLFVKARKT